MTAPEKEAPRPVGTIWVHDLSRPTLAITPLVAVTFRRVGPEALSSLITAAGKRAEIARRFEAGARCYTAWVGSRLAAYGWVSFNEEYIGELQMRITLQPCEAYIWDCYTLPDFRQKRLYSALLVSILDQLRAEPQWCRAWIGADIDNAPSQRGIDRAGFLRVADLIVSRVNARFLIQARGYPGVPDALVAEARRSFMSGRERIWMPAESSGTGG